MYAFVCYVFSFFCLFACVCVFGVRVKTHDMEDAEREREADLHYRHMCHVQGM